MHPQQLQRLRQTRPVFIWAPTQRCGTGLLQRLVTSSKAALIFGEEQHLVHQIPHELSKSARRAEANRHLLDRLAQGDPSGWYVHVFPPDESYRSTLIQHFYDLVSIHQQSAQHLGFSRWGTKYPRFHFREFLILRELLPFARHLFIYRDILDVLRSVKSRGWLTSPSTAAAYCSHWNEGINAIFRIHKKDSAVQIIRYEQLTEVPDEIIPQIERFCQLPPFDRSVFAHRPNKPGDGYVAPSALNPVERRAMEKVSGALRSQLQYQELPRAVNS